MTILREFEYEDHTADIKVIGHGNTPKRAIESVILGIANVIYDIDKVEKKQEININLKANDILEILYKSAKSFLDLFYTKKIVIRDVRVKHLRKIKVREKKTFFWDVDITFFGEEYNPEKHGRKKEVKAVTYHDLNLTKITKSHWIGEVVIDV
ncbi:archease [Nanoarchaeota archaeon NZ13-N]|nr:MAG: archease [Nanoarchaeota archaeon NZ13-N]